MSDGARDRLPRLGAFVDSSFARGGARTPIVPAIDAISRTSFTVWSDKAKSVNVVIHRGGDAPSEKEDARYGKEKEEVLLEARGDGLFTGFVERCGVGQRYELCLDGLVVQDPYARYLPNGVHGPAEIVGPLSARKHRGRPIDLSRAEVLYELHVGTFTSEGTFAGVEARLPELARLGVTIIEIMPLAAFAGRRGWGYDGVALFAPFAGYGSPEDLMHLIDAAHGLGLSVVLDVVYNHLGPDGNYLAAFSDHYFDDTRKTPWGAGPAFDRAPFRKLVLDNVRYWLHDFGFDGLRLDAVHALEPGGDPHILREIAEVAHSFPEPRVLFAEDDRNDPERLFDMGIDAVFSDDFHHVVHVLLTGERDGYYAAYRGDLEELARTIERRQLYEGQVFATSGKPRGRPAIDAPYPRLIYALQNHDQIGNRAAGERLNGLCTDRQFAAASLLLLFLPATPLLFMGQEWAASTPFLYFTDHEGKLGRLVTQGRRAEFEHFRAFAHGGEVPDPQARESFQESKLDWSAVVRPDHAAVRELYESALRLRREDPVLRDGTTELRAGFTDRVLWVTRRSRAGERLLAFNSGPSVSPPELGGLQAERCRPLLTSNVPAKGAVVASDADALERRGLGTRATTDPRPVGSRFDLASQSAAIYELMEEPGP